MTTTSKVKRAYYCIALSILLGVFATAFLDAWNYMQHILLDKPLTRYEFIGRWAMYMLEGVYHHESINAAQPIAGELLVGWFGHYFIGILFALMLLVYSSSDWLKRPSFLPALVVGIVACVIPLFLMYPGMGKGMAGMLTPNPTALQLKVLFSHVVFSVGLYVGGWLMYFVNRQCCR